MQQVSNSKIIFCSRLPQRKISKGITFAICDERLWKFQEVRKFLKKQDHFLLLSGGEKLKTLETLQYVLIALDQRVGMLPKSKIHLVSVGGGSVTDFVGFVASIYKRGVGLTHIPTTWLAAMDSAHGGKTALNIGKVKNQIGTFYAAETIILVRSVLTMQPLALLKQSWGEVAKIALLKKKLRSKMGAPSHKKAWQILPDLIKAKMEIVAKDPVESKGIRKFLNLGHTMGHALEISQKISHGEAVAQGLFFAAALSHDLKILNQRDHDFIISLLRAWGLQSQKFKFNKAEMTSLLLKDKKNTATDLIEFILFKSKSEKVIKNVSVSQCLKTAKGLGWTVV